MRHKLFHCWDCGIRVIEQTLDGKYKPSPCLQQVKFKLSDGSFMVNPFCESCASKDWDRPRLNEFREAIISVMPSFNSVSISSCEGPVSLIEGVVQ